MALYHQLKFPSTFIEYRSVSEWKGVVVISNFDSLEAGPFKSTALASCLVCLGLNMPLRTLLSVAKPWISNTQSDEFAQFCGT